MSTQRAEQTQFRRLYRAGKSDNEIARRLHVCNKTVRKWRENAGLASHRPKLGRLSAAEHATRLAMYKAGATDKEIADKTERDRATISEWRTFRGFPSNASSHLSASADDERMTMYRAGMNDRQISRKLGCNKNSIMTWRQRRGLPTINPHKRNLSAEQLSARRLFYDLGRTDIEIAREQQVDKSAIRAWRLRNSLPAHDRIYKRRRPGDPALDRIRTAVGRALPPDLADDAVADLYLAVLEGKVALDRIESEARTFSNRVVNNFANSFRSRSVDEALAGTDDLLMIDTLVDESAEDWLEEMGATVCRTD